MIKYGYLICGIVYIIVSLFYIGGVHIVLKTHFYGEKSDKLKTLSTEAKYNASRYASFFLLYFTLGIVYILSHYYE